MRSLVNALSAALLLAPMVAHADQFLYAGSNIQTSSAESSSFSFTYISDHRIESREVVTPLTCTADGSPCSQVLFDPREPFFDHDEGLIGVGSGRAGVTGIDPSFFDTREQGSYLTRSGKLTFVDLPDSVRYFYTFDDYYNGGFFEFFSPELITSKTTVSNLICYNGFRLCDDGSSVTIDPIKGEITGLANPASTEINLTGLPSSFFLPGDNRIPSDIDNLYAPSLLVAGRGGVETVTPEPSGLLLLGSGVSGLALLVRRRRAV